MDVLEGIRGRRSVRAFKSGKNVSQETVDELIDAARWAPSAGNIQPWEFVVVRRPEVKKRLAVAAFNQSFVEEAPVVIVACADENRSSEGYGQRGRTLPYSGHRCCYTEHSLGCLLSWLRHVLGRCVQGRRGKRDPEDSAGNTAGGVDSRGLCVQVSFSAKQAKRWRNSPLRNVSCQMKRMFAETQLEPH
jgi:nitroreductase